MTQIPRKLSQWFDKLDLTYAVRNLTNDFANGFLVAEILSRSASISRDIDIYQFYNESSLEKRRDNWQRLQKILKKHHFELQTHEWEPIIHRAKGSALAFLKRLYTHLTGDDHLHDTNASEKKNVPYYMKPTATLLMKNNELNRIVDNDERFEEKVGVLKNFYANSRVEKQRLGLEDFITKQKKKML